VIPIDVHGEWCEVCDWNVDRKPAEQLKPRQRRAQARANARGDRLYEELVREASSVDRRHHLIRFGSYALAVAAQLSSPALLAATVWAWVACGLSPGSVIASLLLLPMAVVTRPRFPSVGRGVVILKRDEAPALYRFVDRLSSALGTRPVTFLGVDSRFNCAAKSVGFRQRRLIVIGLTLWDFLTPQERTAVLCHEIGHDLGGDLTHSALVSSSVRTLSAWYELFRPTHRELRGGSLITGLFFLGVSGVVNQGLRLQLAAARREPNTVRMRRPAALPLRPRWPVPSTSCSLLRSRRAC
jgi:Zn-dependent protease with chaperone function